MRFLFDETKQRYRATLLAMESEKMARLGDAWESTALAFFFADRERGILSVRDTIMPILTADGRTLDDDTRKDLFDSVKLEDTAGNTVRNIHLAYTASTPIG